MNDLTPLNKVFGSERLRFLFETLKPSETPLSWMQETSKPFLKRYGIEKFQNGSNDRFLY